MNCEVYWLEAYESTLIDKQCRELGNVGEEIGCMVAHPQSEILLLGTRGGRVVVWDINQAHHAGAIQAHEQDLTHILFLADDHILTSSVDGTVKLWSLTFDLERQYEVGKSIYGVAVSPRGNEVATGGEDKIVRIWDLGTGNLVQSLPEQSDPITSCSWVGNKTMVVADAKGQIWVWDVDSLRLIRRHKAHNDSISRLVVSRKLWYITSSWDRRIRVWNQQHRPKFSFPEGDQLVTSIALADAENLLVATYWDGMVRIFDVESNKLHDEFRAGDFPLTGCAMVPSINGMVTADEQGSLRFWSMAEMGVHRYVNQHTGPIHALRYTPDNVYALSVGYDGQLKVWDRNDRSENGYIQMHTAPLFSLAISADNAAWAVGTPDGQIKFWNVQEQSFDNALSAHQDAVSAIQFIPIGNRLLTGSWDLKVKIWNMDYQYAECICDGHSKAVSGAEISLDGRRIVTSSWDGTVRIWDPWNRKTEFATQLMCLSGHTERVLCCAMSPDGRLVASGGADNQVIVWPIEPRAEPQILAGHEAPVTVCRFTPDGQLLVTGDRRGVLFVWDLDTGENVGGLQHDKPILALAIAPDGGQAVIGDESGQVRFLELNYAPLALWVPTTLFHKPPPMWMRGAAPIEQFEITCIFCGNTAEVDKKMLGHVWRCDKCRNELRLCPQAFPVVE